MSVEFTKDILSPTGIHDVIKGSYDNPYYTETEITVEAKTIRTTKSNKIQAASVTDQDCHYEMVFKINEESIVINTFDMIKITQLFIPIREERYQRMIVALKFEILGNAGKDLVPDSKDGVVYYDRYDAEFGGPPKDDYNFLGQGNQSQDQVQNQRTNQRQNQNGQQRQNQRQNQNGQQRQNQNQRQNQKASC